MSKTINEKKGFYCLNVNSKDFYAIYKNERWEIETIYVYDEYVSLYQGCLLEDEAVCRRKRCSLKDVKFVANNF